MNLDRPVLFRRLATRTRQLDNGCWLWEGAIKRGGYGHISVEARMFLVHRLAYELVSLEPIPDGYEIDHLCKTRACLNPLHLEAVTKAENLRRGKPDYAPSSRVNRSMTTAHYLRFLSEIKEAEYDRKHRPRNFNAEPDEEGEEE